MKKRKDLKNFNNLYENDKGFDFTGYCFSYPVVTAYFFICHITKAKIIKVIFPYLPIVRQYIYDIGTRLKLKVSKKHLSSDFFILSLREPKLFAW